MKDNKGFTIVELAIVLVVIGVIMAMAVKAKRFIGVAKHKREINKIYKLENAYYIYMATQAQYSTLSVHGNIDLEKFYSRGIITQEELKSDHSLNNEPGYWTPVLCMITDASGGRKAPSLGLPKNNRQNVCAALIVGSSIEGGSHVLKTYSYPNQIQCGIENILDDRNVVTGKSRRTAGSDNVTNFTEVEYSDCLTQPMSSYFRTDMLYIMK